jgi:hypothetical protein
MSIASPMTQPFPGSVWMRWGRTQGIRQVSPRTRPRPDKWRGKTTATKKKAAPTCSLPMNRKPGKRTLKVTEQRTKKDWALFMQEVLEEHYPEAEKVVLVMDNLNTHTPASFYEVFPPEQAKALIDRLEIHYTPKHASWLNIAEIELSVLARQGLAHNIATIEDLCQ